MSSRDLFSDISNGSENRVGGRKRYMVPVSVALHVAAFSSIFIVSLALFKPPVLPEINTAMSFVLAVPVVPPAPAVNIVDKTPKIPKVPKANTSNPPGPTVPTTPEIHKFPLPGKPGLPLPIPCVINCDATNQFSEPPRIPEPPSNSVPKPELRRVGGNIKAPIKVKDFLPIYPEIPRVARLEGSVVLEFIIGMDGKVSNIRVVKSAPLFDQSAKEAVQRWEFLPTRLNGEVVPVLMTVTVNFSLN